jgi:hypothetical protein
MMIGGQSREHGCHNTFAGPSEKMRVLRSADRLGVSFPGLGLPTGESLAISSTLWLNANVIFNISIDPEPDEILTHRDNDQTADDRNFFTVGPFRDSRLLGSPELRLR